MQRLRSDLAERIVLSGCVPGVRHLRDRERASIRLRTGAMAGWNPCQSELTALCRKAAAEGMLWA